MVDLQSVGMPESHGLDHCLTVLAHMKSAVKVNVFFVSCRVLVVIHSKKYLFQKAGSPGHRDIVDRTEKVKVGVGLVVEQLLFTVKTNCRGLRRTIFSLSFLTS